jgi:hypothetical protein
MASVVYLIAHAFGWLQRLDRSDNANELEILVLRHQHHLKPHMAADGPAGGRDRGAIGETWRPVAWRGRAEQPRCFLGTRSGRKIRSGSLLVDALDLDRVPRPLDALLAHV